MQSLAKAFQDSRYIRIDDKPLFLVYRVSNLPNPLKTCEIWRDEARKLGIGEIFLCKVESIELDHGDPNLIGFDASVEFQPDWTQLGIPLQKNNLWRALIKLGLVDKAYRDHNIYEYATMVERMLAKPDPGYKRFSCVTPSWDNSARRQKGGSIILRNSSPQLYENWLKAVVQKTLASESKEKIIFINAWNEWAEGNHLEPCQKWGHAYLEATARALIDT